MIIRAQDLHPEEHLAAFGDRAEHRVKVWRQTYGPVSYFRSEITVCSGCSKVNLARLWPAGSECLGRFIPGEPWGHHELCGGRAWPPTAELGARWIEGEIWRAVGL